MKSKNTPIWIWNPNGGSATPHLDFEIQMGGRHPPLWIWGSSQIHVQGLAPGIWIPKSKPKGTAHGFGFPNPAGKDGGAKESQGWYTSVYLYNNPGSFLQRGGHATRLRGHATGLDMLRVCHETLAHGGLPHLPFTRGSAASLWFSPGSTAYHHHPSFPLSFPAHHINVALVSPIHPCRCLEHPS